MAIAFDAASNPSFKGSSGTSYTRTHTCSGSDRILFVTAYAFNSPAPVVSGVTYNGVAMTKVAAVNKQTNDEMSLWYLINPATGSNNVVMTTSSAASNMGSCCASYTGASQSGGIDSSNSGTANPNTTLTVSTTTIADNCWVVGTASTGSATLTLSTGFGATRATLAAYKCGDSNAVKSPAGSYSMTVTGSSSDSLGLIVASFAPVGASAVSNPAFLLNFV